MANFKYEVIDKEGKQKKGQIAAGDRASAMRALQDDGNVVLELNEPSVLDKEIHIGGTRAVDARDMSVFCRQFVTLNQASVSIVRSLTMLEDQTTNKTLREAVHNTRVSVEKGNTLAESMRSQEGVFNSMFCNLVEAGEQAGKMDVSFDRMAKHFEKQAQLKATVKKAMIYPIILSIVALIVIIIMLVYIVPMYTEMFEQMDTELPAVTLFVVGLSNFITHYWFAIIAGAIVLGILINTAVHTPKGRFFMDGVALKMPILGNLNQKTCCANLARNLSTLIGSGLPIMRALEITADTMDNTVFQKVIRDSRDQVSHGIALHVPLEQSGVVPPMIYHMIGIGEETGAMDTMLEKAADYYEEEVQQATEQAAAALEPMVIIVMAAVVILIIAAVYAPMLTMYSAIGNL